MFVRAAVVAMLAFPMAGCITATNTLSPEQVSSLRLQAVNVQVAPNARIRWGDGERDFAENQGRRRRERRVFG